MGTLEVVDVLFVVALCVLILSSGYVFFKLKKNKEIDLENILPLVDGAIERLFDIKQARYDFDGLVLAIAKQVKFLIDSSNLSEPEREYWTEERIVSIVTKLVLMLMKVPEEEKKEG